MFDVHVAYKARLTPRAIAVSLPSGAVSYADLDADVNRFAAAMVDLGLGRREMVVSLRFDSAYLRLLALLAFARLGVPTSPPGDPRAMVRLVDGPDDHPGPVRLRLDKAQVEDILAAEPRPPPPLDLPLDGVGRILLSSGTTGAPRRIAFSWRRIDRVLRSMLTTYAAGGFRAFVPWTGVDSAMGLANVIAAWATGGQAALGFPTDALPGWLEELPPTLVGLTPIQLRHLLDALPPGFRPRADHRLIVAGSLLPTALAQEARLRLTPDIHIIYGSTETGLIAHAHAADLPAHPGLVGFIPPGTRVRLVGDDGADARAGAVMVSGERVADGYVDDPAATAERFQDGWFDTGDLGRFTDDGRLILEGRADERLNLGGRKFMPAVLENAALACEGVLDAACFAVPDARGLDQAWLAVVAAPGFDRERLAPHLAAYPDMPPPRFAWIDEIPRNDMGKTDRTRLREAVLSALAGAP
ncbi:MAG: long-chain fatty acid--CoA ligase [Phenylobacterium sp.]|uniref:class I adenylate-forming enzyme family protein n=1 Tax=Phenylobacterium sp. TaxID=1871053 RepID=UPI001A4FF2A9|nr:fatty acid--CoA ligase family protein [Phenylobacterium sp.]MBL8770670.1 long-chain fatty acid--CoA ligase [Phenylobacterium sp.]